MQTLFHRPFAKPERLTSRRVALGAVLAGLVGVAGALAGAGFPRVGPAGAATAPAVRWSEAPASPPAGSPPPLAYASAAYDPGTSPPTVVLFGGIDAKGSLSSDTWTWDGSSWLDHPAAATNAPPARELASMAYDPVLHQLVLFGGQGGGGQLLDDTWAWNGISWYRFVPPGGRSSPQARESASMSFEAAGGLLLFGGTAMTAPGSGVQAPTGSPAEEVLGDAWRWTGTSWERLTGPVPPARSGASMTFDAATRQTVLFGGESTPADSGQPQILADTWVWNGRSWAPAIPAAQPAPPAPPGRYGALLDYVPGLGGVLLLCGSGADGALADDWLWSPSGWQQVRALGAQAPRVGGVSSYYAPASEVVVFGGAAAGGAVLGDTALVSPVGSPAPPSTATTRPSTPTTSRAPGPTAAQKPAAATGPARRRTVPVTTAAGHALPAGRSGDATAVRPAGGPEPVAPSLVTSRRSARRGTVLRLAGSGFEPRSEVSVSFHSTPVVIGQVTADPSGAFSLDVAVPGSASPGEHRFVADGSSRTGSPAAATVAVMVSSPGGRGIATWVELVLVGLALLIPVGAWLAMAASGRWRAGRSGGSRAGGQAALE